MPAYNYVAMNRAGKRVKDSIEAANMESAKNSLRSAGYTLLEIKEQSVLDKDIDLPFLQPQCKGHGAVLPTVPLHSEGGCIRL